jgi:hypothetical protein
MLGLLSDKDEPLVVIFFCTLIFIGLHGLAKLRHNDTSWEITLLFRW